MASLTPGARVALRNAVRTYLDRMPNVNSTDRQDSVAFLNNAFVVFMARTFCSSARPPLVEYRYRLHLQALRHATGLSVDFTAVENFQLSSAHALSIQQTLNRRRGISVVHLGIRSPPDGHASLLIFDARTRKQHFFHPWGHVNHWLNKAFRNRNNVLVEGFTPAPLNEDAWPLIGDSIQYILDKNAYGIDGNCGLYCILVGTLCTRFGIGKPRLMADLIIECLRQIDVDNGLIANIDQPPVGSHMPRMWNWMIDREDFAETFTRPPLLPNSTNTPAMVQERHRERQRSITELAQKPALLPGPPHNHSHQKIARRQRLRQGHQFYLMTHPVIYTGHLIDAQTVAERNDAIRNAEVELL
ncbi:unnamed protein product [Ectocarpus sp. 12 AP-2014]